MHVLLVIDKAGYANEVLQAYVVMDKAVLEAAQARMRYEAKALAHRGGVAYWACDDETGLVNFMLHDPANESGYGGANFTLKLKAGGRAKIAGPWSSRPGVMNALGFAHSIEVTVMCGPHDLRGSYSMRIDKLAPYLHGYALKRAKPRNAEDKDVRYEIVKEA